MEAGLGFTNSPPSPVIEDGLISSNVCEGGSMLSRVGPSSVFWSRAWPVFTDW